MPDATTHHTEATAQPRPLRVLVADDDPVVRAGLRSLLAGRPDVLVAAEASDGRQALAAARRHRPDAVLLDVRMPGADTLGVLRPLLRLAPVLMLGHSDAVEEVRRALGLGASGYLVHGEFGAGQLAAAVRDITQGWPVLSLSSVRVLVDEVRQRAAATPVRPLPDGLGTAWPEPVAAAPNVPAAYRSDGFPRQCPGPSAMLRAGEAGFGLTGREQQIMDLVATGMTNREIAAACLVTRKTVKNHINRIFTKLECTDRGAAVARWTHGRLP
ncbi:response regulator [Streptomyces sp. NPDC058045]|uniref:response regulator n=1 Tax=Streptomyces sp. NPDC058045 TaxID=3346311 RepID=UPI0036E01443